MLRVVAHHSQLTEIDSLGVIMANLEETVCRDIGS